MIKFFRKIRQKLLIEGKIKSYLKYAVGEIFLVVIGIMIALQFNNWNNEYNAGIEELALLTEMKNNLEKDLADCIWNINRNQELFLSNSVVLEHLENQTPFHDSLSVHYGNLLGTTTQLRNVSAYDNLKSKGVNLIRNDSLRQEITKVYSARYYYIEMKELEYDNVIQLHQLVPELNGKISFDYSTKMGYPLDVKKLYTDEKLKGVINTNKYVKLFMMGAYKNLRLDIQGLLDLINKELHERNS